MTFQTFGDQISLWKGQRFRFPKRGKYQKTRRIFETFKNYWLLSRFSRTDIRTFIKDRLPLCKIKKGNRVLGAGNIFFSVEMKLDILVKDWIYKDEKLNSKLDQHIVDWPME